MRDKGDLWCGDILTDEGGCDPLLGIPGRKYTLVVLLQPRNNDG
jgi:hypothetical protein